MASVFRLEMTEMDCRLPNCVDNTIPSDDVVPFSIRTSAATVIEGILFLNCHNSFFSPFDSGIF